MQQLAGCKSLALKDCFVVPVLSVEEAWEEERARVEARFLNGFSSVRFLPREVADQ